MTKTQSAGVALFLTLICSMLLSALDTDPAGVFVALIVMFVANALIVWGDKRA